MEALELEDEIVYMDRIRWEEEVRWSRRDLAVIVNLAELLNKRRCE